MEQLKLKKEFKGLKRIIKIYIKEISVIMYIDYQYWIYLFKDKQLIGKTKHNACFYLIFFFG